MLVHPKEQRAHYLESETADTGPIGKEVSLVGEVRRCQALWDLMDTKRVTLQG